MKRICLVIGLIALFNGSLYAATGDVLYSNCADSLGGCSGAGSKTGWARTVESSGCANGKCLKLVASPNGDRYGAGNTSISTGATVGHDEITVVYYVKYNKDGHSIKDGNIKHFRPYLNGGQYMYALIAPWFGKNHYMSGQDSTLIPKPPVTSIDTSRCVSNGDGTYECSGSRRAIVLNYEVGGQQPFPANTWRKMRYWLKLPSTLTSADGEAKLWVDETLVFHLTNVDVDDDKGLPYSSFAFYPSSEAGEPFEHWMDEMVIYDGYVPPGDEPKQKITIPGQPPEIKVVP